MTLETKEDAFEALERARAYYEWLQWAMAGCPPINPHEGDTGNHATSPEQTIEGETPLRKGSPELSDISCGLPQHLALTAESERGAP